MTAHVSKATLAIHLLVVVGVLVAHSSVGEWVTAAHLHLLLLCCEGLHRIASHLVHLGVHTGLVLVLLLLRWLLLLGREDLIKATHNIIWLGLDHGGSAWLLRRLLLLHLLLLHLLVLHHLLLDAELHGLLHLLHHHWVTLCLGHHLRIHHGLLLLLLLLSRKNVHHGVGWLLGGLLRLGRLR